MLQELKEDLQQRQEMHIDERHSCGELQRICELNGRIAELKRTIEALEEELEGDDE